MTQIILTFSMTVSSGAWTKISLPSGVTSPLCTCQGESGEHVCRAISGRVWSCRDSRWSSVDIDECRGPIEQIRVNVTCIGEKE